MCSMTVGHSSHLAATKLSVNAPLLSPTNGFIFHLLSCYFISLMKEAIPFVQHEISAGGIPAYDTTDTCSIPREVFFFLNHHVYNGFAGRKISLMFSFSFFKSSHLSSFFLHSHSGTRGVQFVKIASNTSDQGEELCGWRIYS